MISGHVEVVGFLVQHGFDIRFTTPPPSGWNLLYFAVSSKNITAVQFCLEAGISPSRQVLDGSSPIDFARERGFAEAVSLMERYSDVPPAVQTLSVRQAGDHVQLVVKLPPLASTCPVFGYRSMEISVKENAFLASASRQILDLSTRETGETGETGEVVVDLKEVQRRKQYNAKIRLENGNGWGAWSRAIPAAIEEPSESSESESESESSRSESESESESSESESESESEKSEKREKREKEKANESTLGSIRRTLERKISERLADKPQEKPRDKTHEKPREKAHEKPREKQSDIPPEKPQEKPREGSEPNLPASDETAAESSAQAPIPAEVSDAGIFAAAAEGNVSLLSQQSAERLQSLRSAVK